MADVKISALPSSTTPLAGTEVLPIVQAGTTKQVSVANLTAGRDLSVAELTASDNVVIGTAGKGIDFSANPSAAGMTSKLLDDYEEGTWTVTLYDAATAGNASPTTGTGYYTKIGNMVHCSFFLDNINTTGMTAGNGLNISLPFTSSSSLGRATGSVILNEVTFAAGRTQQNVYIGAGVSRATIQESGSNVARVTLTVGAFTSGSDDIFTFDATYFV